MSYSIFPPEWNSGLIYTGPGSEPLLVAAAAWTALATDLSTSATSTHSVVANLASTWTGTGSAAATTAVAPYVAWLEQASATAAQNAALATQAAGLFEAARAASVPPPVIAANRAMLLALISTNFFGQNTPAIAATEAQYEAMWAQDGAAMDTYAGSAQATTSSLTQQTSPPGSAQATQATPGSAEGGPVVTPPTTPPTGYNPSTIGGLFDMLGMKGLINSIDPQLAATSVSSAMSPLTSASSMGMMGARLLMMLPQLARMGAMTGATGALAGQASGAGGTGTLMTQIGDFVNDKLQGAVGVLAGHFSTATNAISAKLGQAASMGALKVPQAWSMAADGMVRAAPVLPATTVSAPIQTMSATGGIPGGPFGNALMGAMAGRGMGAVAAKAPKIMPRSPAGG
ncbi:PPE family protein [Mycolicibacter sp. MYC123]|uniref:PPE family protein n=1 Tax=[Mycobacterium] zoologicum TaxID=2872311 RepID=A0ABU5YF99_9MYCO|nr:MULTISPECIES: PPE family protein [unclassified Mycolicibacter]MEB3048721.1 PPE family protein [Mycolicibacter sp. MYC123]MEB3063151.1 PPE family protein [Mycolicibacter sp. MYC101]